jgi:hypothetical protein
MVVSLLLGAARRRNMEAQAVLRGRHLMRPRCPSRTSLPIILRRTEIRRVDVGVNISKGLLSQ